MEEEEGLLASTPQTTVLQIYDDAAATSNLLFVWAY